MSFLSILGGVLRGSLVSSTQLAATAKAEVIPLYSSSTAEVPHIRVAAAKVLPYTSSSRKEGYPLTYKQQQQQKYSHIHTRKIKNKKSKQKTIKKTKRIA